MSYAEPRRVVLTIADTRRLTILERARACVLAGIREREIGPLLRAVSAHEGEPDDLERGILLLYAIAYQLERRADPELEWSAAQTWNLALDLDAPADPMAEAEARAAVEASLATGLPPDTAGALTLSHLEAYGEIRADADKQAKRGRTRRRSRVAR